MKCLWWGFMLLSRTETRRNFQRSIGDTFCILRIRQNCHKLTPPTPPPPPPPMVQAKLYAGFFASREEWRAGFTRAVREIGSRYKYWKAIKLFLKKIAAHAHAHAHTHTHTERDNAAIANGKQERQSQQIRLCRIRQGGRNLIILNL